MDIQSIISFLAILGIFFIFLLFFLKLTKQTPWWSRGTILLGIGALFIIYQLVFSIEIACRNFEGAMDDPCGIGEFITSMIAGLFFITLGFLFFFGELIHKNKKKNKIRSSSPNSVYGSAFPSEKPLPTCAKVCLRHIIPPHKFVYAGTLCEIPPLIILNRYELRY